MPMVDFLDIYHNEMVSDVISFSLQLIAPVWLYSSGDFKKLLGFYEIWNECHLTRGHCTSEGFNLSVYFFHLLFVPL